MLSILGPVFPRILRYYRRAGIAFKTSPWKAPQTDTFVDLLKMSRKSLSYERIPDVEGEVESFASDRTGFLSRASRKAILVFVLVFIGGGVLFSYYMSRNPQLVNGYEDVEMFLTSQTYGDRLHAMSESDFRERGIPIESFNFNSVSQVPRDSLLSAKVHVDRNIQYQEIIGFGGAFTEASAHNYFQLDDKTRQKFIEHYFGRDGIGYTIGRIHINSCDFSLGSYSFDDKTDDYELHHFDHDVTHDRHEIIPFLLAAIRAVAKAKAGDLRLLASPWSPPAWMKVPFVATNTSNYRQTLVATMTGSHIPNGLRDDADVQQAWAQYISYFIYAYKQAGVPIWAVTPQNEPEFAAPWEACAYDAPFESDFVEGFLGPVLRADHPDVKILGFDHNKDHLVAWAKTLLFPSSPSQYIDGMAFHWYAGTGDRLLDGTYGYDALNETYHMAPDKILLATEGCSCPGIEVDGWLRAERLGHDLIYDLNNFAQGWIDWNLLVDYKGGPNHLGNVCDAPIFATKNFEDIHLQPKYYYMGHISKFVPPGSVRIQSLATGDFNYQRIATDVHSGIELVALYNMSMPGQFACEQSARQMWTWHSQSSSSDGRVNKSHGTVRLLTGTDSGVSNKPNYQMCFARGDSDRRFLRVWECEPENVAVNKDPKESGTPPDERVVRSLKLVMETIKGSDNVRLIEVSDSSSSEKLCVSLAGGSVAAGGLMELLPCDEDEILQQWQFSKDNGELTAAASGLCVTAGWPYLSSIAFSTPNGKTVLVLMNEAPTDTFVDVEDTARGTLRTVITGHSIATIIY